MMSYLHYFEVGVRHNKELGTFHVAYTATTEN